MPENYPNLIQTRQMLLRIKAYLDTQIENAFLAYDENRTIYEFEQSLQDSSGNQIQDNTAGDLSARLLLITM